MLLTKISKGKNTSAGLESDTTITINIINYDNKTKNIVVEGWYEREVEVDKMVDKIEFQYNSTILDPIISHSPQDNNKLHFVLKFHPENEKVLKVFNTARKNKTKLSIAYTPLSRISMLNRFDYRILNNWLAIPNDNQLIFRDIKLVNVLFREIGFFLFSLVQKQSNSILRSMILSIVIEPIRIMALLRFKFKKQPIWLFSDRMTYGGDNSEALYRYISKKNTKNVKMYFTVDKHSKTYKKLKKDNYKVVNFRSIRRLYLTIVSELIFPSHLEPGYTQPLTKAWMQYCGLVQYKIVHTQHGLVLNDMSEYIGKRKTNAELFLLVSEWEKKQLLKPKYGYSNDQAVVVGAPRYDNLIDSSVNTDQKIIAVHPTWRSWLASSEHKGKREYDNTFNKSKFYKFYSDLLNDKRVIKSLEQNNFILKFYLHPNHQENLSDFSSSNESVIICSLPYDYNKIFSESTLFITDYSNTLFDFAYLKKPIIHCQFDKEEYFSKQVSTSKQIFDYPREGLGVVCSDYELTIEEILKFVTSGQVGMSPKYEKRVSNFFAHIDNKNSQRAYEAVKNLVGDE